MGKRPSARTSANKFCLYAPYEELGDWFRVRNVSLADGERMCRLGQWSRVYCANGAHVGYEMCPRSNWNAHVTNNSPRGLSASEMALYAGRAFRRGKSRTSALTEEQRLTRRNEQTGLPLPPEDAVERVEAKVKYFGEHRLVA